MECGRTREWEALVRLLRGMSGCLAGSVIRRLLTLCGLAVAGLLLGGAGTAHAEATSDDAAIASTAAVPTTAPTRALRGVGAAVQPARGALDEQVFRRSAGPVAGSLLTIRRRGVRTTAGVMEGAPALGLGARAASSCRSVGDPMDSLCDVSPTISMPSPEDLLPQGIRQALIGLPVPVGIADGNGEAWRHADSKAAELGPSVAVPKGFSDVHVRFLSTPVHPEPVHLPAAPESRTPKSTAPTVTVPFTGAESAAFLSGLRFPANGHLTPTSPTGVIAPSVHSAVGEPSFSPD